MFNFFKSAKRSQPSKPAKAKSPQAKPSQAKPEPPQTLAEKAAEKAAGKPVRDASPPVPLPPPSGAGTPSADQADDPLALPPMPSLAMTPARAQLIEKAMSVHRSQQKTVFADLDQKDRQKLMVMAMLTLLRQKTGNGGNGKG
jgi:hypothetical protein